MGHTFIYHSAFGVRRSLGWLAFTLIVLAYGIGGGSVWAQSPGTIVISGTQKSPAAILREGLELYRTKRCAEAASAFTRYLESYPDSWPTHKLLAQCYLDLQQPQRALSHLREITAHSPQDLAAQQALRQAEKMLRQQREEEAKKPKPEEIQQWFVQAEKQIKENKLDTAENLLLKVLQERPEMEPALRRMAEIYAGTERFLESAALYRRLVRLGGPRQREMELRLARTLAWAQQYTQAITRFESYLGGVPEDASARFDLAEVYRWTNRPRNAIAHYQLVLQNQPDNVAARLGLALSYRDLERPAEALQEFDAVLQVNPENQQARKARAQSFDKILQEKKRLAFAAQEQKNYTEAIRLLTEYAQSHPEETEILRRLARLHSWSNQFAGARRYYERYLDAQPTDQAARLELAEVLSWQRDYASARQAFLLVLEAEPENARALAGLIRCYQWSGALDGVETYLERLQKLDPRSTLVAEVRQELTLLQRQRALLQQQRMREHAEQLQHTKDYAAAVEAYRQYLAVYGPDRRIELRIPRLYAWNHQYEKAIEEYRAYLFRYPSEHNVRIELADVQRWHSDYEGALQNYATFLAEEPRNPGALLGRAEALYASSTDLFKVRNTYQQVLQAKPRDTLATDRLREIGKHLQPVAQLPTFGLLDSDKFARTVVQPQVTFLLPGGYRLVPRFQGSYTHQDRLLPGDDPDIAQLNRDIAKHNATLWGARTGLRVERERFWGGWGVETGIGKFSNDRLSFTYGGDLTLNLSERGQLWSRYEHEEASFDLNTLASLVAGVMSDSGRVRYQHHLPHDFEFSSGYNIAHLSASDRFRFSDNLRQEADLRLTYRRFRSFQPGYSYSVQGYRSVSPLYFSPGLAQAHRFDYLLLLGQRQPLQLLVNGSLGIGRIDGVNNLEFVVTPQLSLRLPQKIELELRYHFGQSRNSSFGNPVYRVHGFSVTARFALPTARY